MRSFILNENEMNEMAKRQPTPFLMLSVDKVAENYAFLRKHLPRAGIYYAIKANPHPRALERLAAFGSHFDVASPRSAHTSTSPRPARWKCSMQPASTARA